VTNLAPTLYPLMRFNEAPAAIDYLAPVRPRDSHDIGLTALLDGLTQ
jgi:hypothetical protein